MSTSRNFRKLALLSLVFGVCFVLLLTIANPSLRTMGTDEMATACKPKMDNDETATASKPVHHKPKMHFRTYGNEKFEKSRTRICEEARATGWFDTVEYYTPERLSEDFRAEYADILQEPRGGGYWIWKLNVLKQTLHQVDEGDFIFYVDAGCKINPTGEKRFYEYVDMLNNSCYESLVQQSWFPENRWTTEKIFDAYDIGPNDTIRESGQIIGGIIMLQKGDHSRFLLKMAFSILEKDRWLFSDRYNKENKAINPMFKENRHDQSIFSVLFKRFGAVRVFPMEIQNKTKYPFHAVRIQE